VVTHRLELGTWERDRINTLVGAESFNKVATPVVTAINDNATLLLIGGLLSLFLPGWIPDDWKEQIFGLNTIDTIMDWLEPQNLVGAAVGAGAGVYLLGPLGLLIGAFLGAAGVEAAEEIAEAATGPGSGTRAIAILMMTIKALDEVVESRSPGFSIGR
jgi:hypothetical protein